MSVTIVLSHISPWLNQGRQTLKSVLVIASVMLWLIAAHSIAIWIWALTFILHGAFETLEPALYFAMVSFTTLGFGDIILPVETRLFSGMAAANGLLAFGLSTAFLVEFLIRLRRAHLESGPQNNAII
ncbi:MAG: potassium channel family protein [Kordiimonadaceae bacterium]|nr:potassium channel family protein [Kordiimonadaceae bacterium]